MYREIRMWRSRACYLIFHHSFSQDSQLFRGRGRVFSVLGIHYVTVYPADMRTAGLTLKLGKNMHLYLLSTYVPSTGHREAPM